VGGLVGAAAGCSFRNPGGIQELREQGLVAHNSRLGYYSLLAPPPKLAFAGLGRPVPDGLAGGRQRLAARGGRLPGGRSCPGNRPDATDQAGAAMSGHKREQGVEVCGVGMCTEELTNSSDAPGQYDEPEGTSPDGKSTCVAPDRGNGMRKKGHQYVDIWRQALDGSGRMERLTHFNNYQR
jgi:hypothetical protein